MAEYLLNPIVPAVSLRAKTQIELQQLIIDRVGVCSHCHIRPACQIRQLGGLTHASLNCAANTFTREDCMEILDEHFSCPNYGSGCQNRPVLSPIELRALAAEYALP